jgi:hypothetical protein
MDTQKRNNTKKDKTQAWIVVVVLIYILYCLYEDGLTYGLDLYTGKIAFLSLSLIGSVIYLVKIYKNDKNEYPAYPDNWDEIRKRILKRDSYTCCNCRATNTILHVHHVVPLSSDRGTSEDSNLVTLCEDCHKAIHPHMR